MNEDKATSEVVVNATYTENPSMLSLEALLSSGIRKKLNDGTIDKLIDEQISEIIKRCINDSFSYRSEAYEKMKDKIAGLMCRAIDDSNFDKYTTKITEVINTAINDTHLGHYNAITKNLKELLDNDKDISFNAVVGLGDIVKRYEEFLENYYCDQRLDFDDVDIIDEDSEFGYTTVNYTMTIKDISPKYGSTESYIIEFTNDGPSAEDSSVQFKLTKYPTDTYFTIYVNSEDFHINDIRYMNDMLIYLLKLKQSYVCINIDGWDPKYDEETTDEVCVKFVS